MGVDPGDSVADPSSGLARLDRDGQPVSRDEPLAELEAVLTAACRQGDRYAPVWPGWGSPPWCGPLGFLRAVEVPIIANNGLLQDVRGDEVLAVFETRPDDALRAGLAMLRSLRDHNRERAAVARRSSASGSG